MEPQAIRKMTNNKRIRQVTVYCASSSRIKKKLITSARQLGAILADEKVTVVYGGGGAGLMGAVADGALASGGTVIGVIPQFMVDLEWGHKGISRMIIVRTMHQRKKKLLQDSDAVIALPGGSGTLEELLEVISLKRLGLYLNPIIIVNIDGFYDAFKTQLERCIQDKFMDPRHSALWTFVDLPQQVLPAILAAPKWSPDARTFAVMR
jgi:uncharacterized protein (TIGR00730 family)